MPYIIQEEREFYTDDIKNITTNVIELQRLHAGNVRPGHLNYIITSLLKNSYRGELKYAQINEIIGILECAKQEFYRHVAGPYEIKKILENGDV